MDAPQRLLDGTGTALEQALLQELRSYHGPRNLRAHTLAALGVTGTAGLVVGDDLGHQAAPDGFGGIRPAGRPRGLLRSEARLGSTSAAGSTHRHCDVTLAAVARDRAGIPDRPAGS
jgi:hypothetical protein